MLEFLDIKVGVDRIIEAGIKSGEAESDLDPEVAALVEVLGIVQFPSHGTAAAAFEDHVIRGHCRVAVEKQHVGLGGIHLCGIGVDKGRGGVGVGGRHDIPAFNTALDEGGPDVVLTQLAVIVANQPLLPGEDVVVPGVGIPQRD